MTGSPATARPPFCRPIVAGGGGGLSPDTDRSRVAGRSAGSICRCEVVTAHTGPAAYRVETTAGGVVETVLPVRVLP